MVHVLGYRGKSGAPHFRHSQPLLWLALPIRGIFPDYVTCVTAPDFFGPRILCQEIQRNRESMGQTNNEREEWHTKTGTAPDFSPLRVLPVWYVRPGMYEVGDRSRGPFKGFTPKLAMFVVLKTTP